LTYLYPEIREPLIPEHARSHDTVRESSDVCLTEREAVVLQLLAERQRSKEIALMLEVSSKTIDACRRQLMQRLKVDSMAGFVKRALAMGVITLAS
jgi:NarL family two-component system response regulator LiaR